MRCIWIVGFVCSILCATDAQTQVGVEQYAAALREENPDARSRLLNEALEVFLTHEGKKPSGQLLYNIGNCSFHLGDLGSSIAYYRRAEVQLPRSHRVIKNLTIALQRAEVEGKQIYAPMADFLGARWLSPFERGLVSIGLIAATLLFFSLHLWLPRCGFRWVWRMSALITAVFLINLSVYALFMPLRAVVVRESPLQMSVDPDAESLSRLSPGEMVSVVSYHADGQLVEVQTAMDVRGYLPVSKIVVIR